MCIQFEYVADAEQPVADAEAVADAGADPHRPDPQLLHRELLLPLLPVDLQRKLLLPAHPDDRHLLHLHHGARPPLADLPPPLRTPRRAHPRVQVDLHRRPRLPGTHCARAGHPAERVGEPGPRLQRLLDLEQRVLRVPVLRALPELPALLRLPAELQHQGGRPQLLPARALAQVMDPQQLSPRSGGYQQGKQARDQHFATEGGPQWPTFLLQMRERDLSFPLILFSISQSMCWINDSRHQGHSSPYFSTLFARYSSRRRFSIARLFMRDRYSSKLISFSSPSAVFSSPSKITSISCSSRPMISFSSARALARSTSSLARTKSSSRVSSTVMRQQLGLQYMRNWARWKRFLLSAEFLSMVHFLYMFTNSFSVIFRLRSSSNSQIIRSISPFPIRTPIRRSVSPTSSPVKNLCP